MSRRLLMLMAIIAMSVSVPLGAAQAADAGAIAGEWASVPALPATVTPTAAVGGNDGRIYVFGYTNGSNQPRTFIFNPQTSKWTKGRPSPARCVGATAAAVGKDGRIRLAGCWKDMMTDSGFRMAIYDPVANSWRMARRQGPYVDPIVGMTRPDGGISWYAETLRKDGTAVFVSGHRVVEKRAGRWLLRARQPGDLLDAPSDGAAYGGDGRVWVAGGSRNCFPDIQTCKIRPAAAWTPRSNVWSGPTKVPTPRIKVTVAADAAGKLFVIGGLSPDGQTGYQLVEVLLPKSGRWVDAPPLPEFRFNALSAATADGRVWVLGGYDQFGNPHTDGFVFHSGG